MNHNTLLKHFYKENYLLFKNELSDVPDSDMLELGSGAGFIKEYIPECITSDIRNLDGIDQVIDATALPYESQSLSGICMINVFHHISNVGKFLQEADRTLKPSGKIVMIEPSNTRWARLIYKYLHHEPFETDNSSWKLPPGDPFYVANGALPWMVFKRDWQEITSRLFPNFIIEKMQLKYPLLYLLSGGLSWPQIVPKRLGIRLDNLFGGGMFYEIVISKKPSE